MRVPPAFAIPVHLSEHPPPRHRIDSPSTSKPPDTRRHTGTRTSMRLDPAAQRIPRPHRNVRRHVGRRHGGPTRHRGVALRLLPRGARRRDDGSCVGLQEAALWEHAMPDPTCRRVTRFVKARAIGIAPEPERTRPAPRARGPGPTRHRDARYLPNRRAPTWPESVSPRGEREGGKAHARRYRAACVVGWLASSRGTSRARRRRDRSRCVQRARAL